MKMEPVNAWLDMLPTALTGPAAYTAKEASYL